jgi:hypothetical protein
MDMFSRSMGVLVDTETVHQVLGLLLTGEMYIWRNKTLFSGLVVLVMEQPSRVDRRRGWSGRSGGSCSILLNTDQYVIT